MSAVHLTLQGKGGIGKSLVCRLLGEYLRARCYDADPTNHSLTACKGLNLQLVNLLGSDNLIDPEKLSEMFEEIVTVEENVVVDLGASSWIEVDAFWREHSLEQVLLEQGKEVWFHQVVVGGPANGDCVGALAHRIDHRDKRSNLCVWENEYFGPIRIEDQLLTNLFDFDKLSLQHVVLPQRSRLFAAAFEDVIRDGELLGDATMNTKQILVRQRLTQIQDDLWGQLNHIFDKPKQKKQI